MNWHEQSEEARKQGICHTREECERGYAELPEGLKRPAIEFLRIRLAEDADKIREEIAKDSEGWNIPYHLFWGMNVRNALRQHGFGEEHFDIDNLDCIYKFLVEDAVRISEKNC